MNNKWSTLNCGGHSPNVNSPDILVCTNQCGEGIKHTDKWKMFIWHQKSDKFEVVCKESKWGCVSLWRSSLCCCQQVGATKIQKFSWFLLAFVTILRSPLSAACGLKCYTCWGANPGTCNQVWTCADHYDRCATTIGKLNVSHIIHICGVVFIFSLSTAIMLLTTKSFHLFHGTFHFFLCCSCWKYDHQRMHEKWYVWYGLLWWSQMLYWRPV